jgi:hypothetical protein
LIIFRLKAEAFFKRPPRPYFFMAGASFNTTLHIRTTSKINEQPYMIIIARNLHMYLKDCSAFNKMDEY